MCVSLAQTVLHNCLARVTANENKQSQPARCRSSGPFFQLLFSDQVSVIYRMNPKVTKMITQYANVKASHVLWVLMLPKISERISGARRPIRADCCAAQI